MSIGALIKGRRQSRGEFQELSWRRFGPGWDQHKTIAKSFGLALAAEFVNVSKPYGFTEKTPQG
jgi:hypothetical protein